MSEFSPAQLLTALEPVLSTQLMPRFCVALSGGLDSVVLLHAMAELRRAHPHWRLRAIHVDHQLQAQSTAWAERCVLWAMQLNVPCGLLRVQVDDVKTQGVEAAARNARYAALQAALVNDEVLLTAHHADDQLETMLLALMRGAGVDGLAAMPVHARFAQAWHLRPLLGFTRDELQAWAQLKQLPFINDPSNSDVHYDRNYLRHQVLPLLKQRWPSLVVTASRSASHLSEAQRLLHEYVTEDYAQAGAVGTLRVAVLRELSSPRRHALLRYWLQTHEVLMPSTRVLHALEHDLLNAAEDRVPCTRWHDYAVYRYRDHLYVEKGRRPLNIDVAFQWRWRDELRLPHALGSLSLTSDAVTPAQAIDPGSLPEMLTVRFRQGGEQLRLPRDSHHRELKKLMQGVGVLPWWRGRLPLIYAGEQLVAVADRWVSADFVAKQGAAVQVRWQLDSPGRIIKPGAAEAIPVERAVVA